MVLPLQNLIVSSVMGPRRVCFLDIKYTTVNRMRTTISIKENIKMEFGLPKRCALIATSGKDASENIVNSPIIF